jgi:methionyl-tRNA formyltransferase
VSAARLRVLLCTSGGCNGAVVLERLLACERIELAGLLVSTRILGPRQGFLSGVAGYLRRSGFAYTAYLACSTTVADLLIGSVASRARKREIPLLATPRINDPEGMAFVAKIAPDLLVSAYFNQVIDADVAGLPRLGAVNIHPGLLPGFKGVDPVFFAMLRGALTLGVTIHRTSPELDSGDILAQATLQPEAGESVLHANARLYDRGAALLTGLLDELEARVPGKAQDSAGTYDSWPSRADVAALRNRAVRLVRASDVGGVSRIVESGRSTIR